MNKKRTLEVMRFLLAVAMILLAAALFIGLHQDQSKWNAQCQELGFDGVTQISTVTNQKGTCYIQTTYNREQAKYDLCYMPLEYNVRAQVWCNGEKGD